MFGFGVLFWKVRRVTWAGGNGIHGLSRHSEVGRLNSFNRKNPLRCAKEMLHVVL